MWWRALVFKGALPDRAMQLGQDEAANPAPRSTLRFAGVLRKMPIKPTLVTAPTQPPVRQKCCQDQQRAHDQEETVRVLGQGNATYIHAEQACHQVDRQ